jgi:hypothetical protein
MVADPPPLGGLVPAEPEELLTRGALGAPGRLRIEVGLSEPRFARPEGRRTSKEEMALLRALGGVSYRLTGSGFWPRPDAGSAVMRLSASG